MSRLSELTREAALRDLARALAELDRPARVAVDGPDAAGKTTLAGELAELLAAAGAPVERISADDFLRPAEHRYRAGRDSAEGYYRDSFDHARLRAHVQEARGLVLVDGIFLQRRELDGLWSFRIFVAVSPEESLRRGVGRDLELHPSAREAERLYRTRYLPGQRVYEEDARPRERADVVVENDEPGHPRLAWREGVRPPGA